VYIEEDHPAALLNGSQINASPSPPKLAVLWKQILKNRPFRCTVIAHVCYNYGYYVVLSWVSDYFKTEYHADYAKLGLVSMLPYCLLLFTNPAAGFWADWMERNGTKTVKMRKIINSFGMFGAAIGFWLSGYIAEFNTPGDKQKYLYLAAIVLAVTVSVGGFMVGGIWSNFRDLSKVHSPVLVGISNSVASILGIVGQGVTGYILKWTNGGWMWVFLAAGIIEACGALVFVIGARAEDQRFGKEQPEELGDEGKLSCDAHGCSQPYIPLHPQLP